MQARMFQLDGVTSSSREGAVVLVLSSIGHGVGLLIVKLSGLVPVDTCTLELFA